MRCRICRDFAIRLQGMGEKGLQMMREADKFGLFVVSEGWTLADAMIATLRRHLQAGAKHAELFLRALAKCKSPCLKRGHVRHHRRTVAQSEYILAGGITTSSLRAWHPHFETYSKHAGYRRSRHPETLHLPICRSVAWTGQRE